MRPITIVFSIISVVLAFAPINEVERNYRSYEDASRQACLYVLTGLIDSGPIDKQIPPAFTLNRYSSNANQPLWINGKAVGLGYNSTSTGDLIDFIRIDYDSTKKFHFRVQALNADRTAIDDTKIRLVAKFPSTAKDSDKHFQSLVEPLNRKRNNNSDEYQYSPTNIWDIWKSGKRF
ncbi:hypothetical protein B0J17DRAFT_686202 [Rhizoctonia solani]|nr:hypothetical protein B0J17DRAFT_686202 [Rhizoctonia solani]